MPPFIYEAHVALELVLNKTTNITTIIVVQEYTMSPKSIIRVLITVEWTHQAIDVLSDASSDDERMMNIRVCFLASVYNRGLWLTGHTVAPKTNQCS